MSEPVPRLAPAGLDLVIDVSQGTDDICGLCAPCLSEPCTECSMCESGYVMQCIATYCERKKSHLLHRVAMRKLYLESLKKKAEESSNKTWIMSALETQQRTTADQMVRNKRGYDCHIYGSGEHSRQIRRCGECIGCTRDECGICLPCQDRPRFGGPGVKKQACVERTCRTKRFRIEQ